MKSMARRLLERVNPTEEKTVKMNESRNDAYIALAKSGVNKDRQGEVALNAQGKEVSGSVVLDDKGYCYSLRKDNSFYIVKIDPLTDEVDKVRLFRDEYDTFIDSRL